MAQAHIFAPAVFYIPPMQIVAPHDIENSYLLLRARTRSALFAMPPLATSISDQKFVDLATAWINQIPLPPWQSSDIGPALIEGSAELDGDNLRVSSAGAGVEKNSHFFIGRSVAGPIELSAAIPSVASDSAAAEGGLMLRSTFDPNALAAALLRDNTSVRFVVSTGGTSGFKTIAATTANASRLKLLTDGKSISAWSADDQLNWQQLGAANLDLGLNYLAGFAAASGGEASQFAAAQFTDLRLSAVGLSSGDSDGDGFSDALETSLGYDPQSAEDKPTLDFALVNGAFELHLTRRSEPSHLALVVETSTDLAHWTPIGEPTITQQSFDAHLTWTVASDTQRQFIRLSVLDRPLISAP
jgi:regulation of enolase protein 1 (concanavalin A-like superfamily)